MICICKKIKTVAMVMILIFGVVTCKSDNPVPTKSLDGSGKWKRYDKRGRLINISFDKGGKYFIQFHSIRMKFDGTYNVSGDAVRIVDRYCGNALPGVYRFMIKNDSLHFEILNDSLCERRKILPGGVWVPEVDTQSVN